MWCGVRKIWVSVFIAVNEVGGDNLSSEREEGRCFCEWRQHRASRASAARRSVTSLGRVSVVSSEVRSRKVNHVDRGTTFCLLGHLIGRFATCARQRSAPRHINKQRAPTRCLAIVSSRQAGSNSPQ